MSTPVSCVRLNEIYVDSLLNDHDTFLFDCHGVLWSSPVVLPGAIELLNHLTALVTEKDFSSRSILQGKRVFFATNNSLKTQRGFAQWLTDIG